MSSRRIDAKRIILWNAMTGDGPWEWNHGSDNQQIAYTFAKQQLKRIGDSCQFVIEEPNGERYYYSAYWSRKYGVTTTLSTILHKLPDGRVMPGKKAIK